MIKMDLTGTWKVRVTSGPRWFKALNLLRDEKVIDGDKGVLEGYNVAYGKKWGKFRISRAGTLVVLGSRETYYLFDYTDLPIIDRIWAIDKDLLGGEFYWKAKPIGKFEMIHK